MTLDTLPARLLLGAGELLRIHAPRGEVLLDCEAGHLWVTEESQPADVWLAAGQRLRLVGEGLAIVEAKGEARVRVMRA